MYDSSPLQRWQSVWGTWISGNNNELLCGQIILSWEQLLLSPLFMLGFFFTCSAGCTFISDLSLLVGGFQATFIKSISVPVKSWGNSCPLSAIRAHKLLILLSCRGIIVRHSVFLLKKKNRKKKPNQCGAIAAQAPDHLTFLHLCTICSNQHHICCSASPAPRRPRLLGEEVFVNVHSKQVWRLISVGRLI